jgi:DNA helicase HerA-like ATPase
MSVTSGIGGGAAGPWYRVLAVSESCFGGTADRDYAAVLPTALNAARQRRPFIAGWLSRGGGAPLELITNAGPLPAPRSLVRSAAANRAAGRPHESDGHDDEADPAVAAATGQPVLPAAEELLFPWGARGVPVTGNLLADLDELVWAPCPGRQVYQPAEAADAGGPAAAGSPGLFESALQTLMSRPFGWLVVADPTDLLDDETAELRTQLDVLSQYQEERARFEAERAQRRLAELDAYREAGLWNVRVLVGAATEAELSLVSPVLVGAIDLRAHPYRLRSADGAYEFADALAAKVAEPADGAQVPFAVTAGALAALTALPRAEVPGVRVIEPGSFDVTSEVASDQSIDLGVILDSQDREVGQFRVPLATLNRHAFVTGATGAGKSQTVMHMLEQLTKAGVSWLAIEPVKSEYSALAARLRGTAEVTVLNPADPASVPMSVNPLAPEPGYPVQAHIDMVRALFLAAFDAREPFPQIMSQALQLAYEECGWDPLTGSGQPGLSVPPAVPTLARLQAAALSVIEDVGYGRELQADMRGFVDIRLRSLRTGSAGRFFEGGHPADIGELLRRNAVLAIEDVANDEDKAFLIGTLIIRIVEHLRLRAKTERDGQLRHVIVIEEAHRLLRASREGASAHAVELFASMLAEIRAYGVGIVVAEQIPAKLVPDVVKNTALKVLHRLPASDDRQVVGAAMNLDPGQSRQVVSLTPGVAAVFADGMDRPVRLRVPYAGAAEPGGSLQPELDPPVAGRRSAACGQACTGGQPCTLLEIREADLLAADQAEAWLRVWSEALVLAHLTNRQLPRVPVPLRQRWAQLDDRLRECAFASALDRPVQGRALAVRPYFDPDRLAAECAATGRRLLGGGNGAGTLASTEWVIPQLQWLHELERACPLGSPPPDPFGPAPPLVFAIPGLAGRPDVTIGQRITALRRHPASMELARNRRPAWQVLLGEDDQRGFIEDLESVAIGVSHRGQLRRAAGEMGIAGWLEVVLSWPRRFIVGYQENARAAEDGQLRPVPAAAPAIAVSAS